MPGMPRAAGTTCLVVVKVVGVVIVVVVNYTGVCHEWRLWGFAVGLADSWIVEVVVVAVVVVVVVNYMGICHGWGLWDFAVVLTRIGICTRTAGAMSRALRCREERSIFDFAVSLAVVCIVIAIVVGVAVVIVVNYTGICHGWRLWGFPIGPVLSSIVVVVVVAVVAAVVVRYTGICHGWRLWDFAAVLTRIQIWTQMAPARLKALGFQGRGICGFAVVLTRIWV